MGYSSVLFVCMGNICRSPLAEGIARKALEEAGISLRLDSAGTHDYHIGRGPDQRACAIARETGCDIDGFRARHVVNEDFHAFDLILAADAANLAALQRQQPDGASAELALLLPWCGAEAGTELPDPYYGDDENFRHVVALLRDAMPGLVRRLQARA